MTGEAHLVHDASRWDENEYLILIASSQSIKDPTTIGLISEGKLVDSFPSRIQPVEVDRTFVKTYVNRVTPANLPNISDVDLSSYALRLRPVGQANIIDEEPYGRSSNTRSEEKFVKLNFSETLATGQEYEIIMVNKRMNTNAPLAYSKFTYTGSGKKDGSGKKANES